MNVHLNYVTAEHIYLHTAKKNQIVASASVWTACKYYSM